MARNRKHLRIVKKNGPRLSLDTLVLVLACTWLIIVSTFVQFDIVHNAVFNRGSDVVTYRFIPQIPVVLFAGALLGRRYGMLSVILYIIIGLFFAPVFALGGGVRYIFEYGFGYILAYIPALFFMTSILQSGFSLRNMAHAALVGVLTIHVIGVVYMFFMAGIHHEGWGFMQSWILAQSGTKVIYDFVFTLLTLFFTRYIRIILWLY